MDLLIRSSESVREKEFGVVEGVVLGVSTGVGAGVLDSSMGAVRMVNSVRRSHTACRTALSSFWTKASMLTRPFCQIRNSTLAADCSSASGVAGPPEGPGASGQYLCTLVKSWNRNGSILSKYFPYWS